MSLLTETTCTSVAWGKNSFSSLFIQI